MGEWTIIRERFSLSGLPLLSAATGGASESWVFAEPSVSEVNSATQGGEIDNAGLERLATACVRDAEGARVFGKKTAFSDLPNRAANELIRFALERLAPDSGKDDAADGETDSAGKP